MNRPLVLARQVVESRLRRLTQKLNDELGYRDQRLHFLSRPMRSGPITWRLQNNQLVTAGIVMPRGTVAELAAAKNDESVLYFGYNEEWQPARGRDHLEFVSCNLQFVIAGVEDIPNLRFRLEWAGLKTEGSTVRYPGVGAAHPHWQFDVDAGWFDREPPAAEGIEEEFVKISLEPIVENVDFGDDRGNGGGVIAPPRVSATLAGFHRLHLPARTMWHELQCDMPHVATPQQHTPGSKDQIDRWVISALHYLKSEFQTYL
jgi:hypothetical protein